MTLDQAFSQYQGQSLLVPGDTEDDRGQCVQWADYVLHEVYDLPYHFGNAIDWWNNPGELLANFDKLTDGSVKKGDFVIFNQQVGSVYGHIDVALQDGTTQDFIGADSNWGKNLTVHQVHHSGANFVLGVLRKKQEENKMVDGNLINELFVGILFRLPRAEEVQRYDGKTDCWSLAHELNGCQERQDLLANIHNAGGIAQSKLDQIKKITG